MHSNVVTFCEHTIPCSSLIGHLTKALSAIARGSRGPRLSIVSAQSRLIELSLDPNRVRHEYHHHQDTSFGAARKNQVAETFELGGRSNRASCWPIRRLYGDGLTIHTVIGLSSLDSKGQGRPILSRVCLSSTPITFSLTGRITSSFSCSTILAPAFDRHRF